MSELHIAQVGFFKPVLDGLSEAGANVDDYLKVSGLDRFQLNNPEHYVPVRSLYVLFDQLEKQQGTAYIFEHFADRMHVAKLLRWGLLVADATDLLSACYTAVKYGHIVFSNQRIGLELNSDTSKLWSCFVDKPAPGREQAIYLNLAMMMDIFRLAAGEDWTPLEMHFQSRHSPPLTALLHQDYRTKTSLNESSSAIIFPTSMLKMPMIHRGAPLEPGDTLPKTPFATSARIERLFESTQKNLVPSMKLLSKMTGMSSSSLQRKLAKEDTAFVEILDQWRFKRALQMLSDPAMRIKDISEQLRYANVPNFERAFRRWTNTTPRRYREALKKKRR